VETLNITDNKDVGHGACLGINSNPRKQMIVIYLYMDGSFVENPYIIPTYRVE
jgi:hypothetical protein